MVHVHFAKKKKKQQQQQQEVSYGGRKPKEVAYNSLCPFQPLCFKKLRF